MVLAMIMGWSWRGSGGGVGGDGYRMVQKNAKKMKKNARIFAYMEKKQYLCIGFGNSPSHNHLILKSYGH